MSRRNQTISPSYFEELYAQNGDPWNFAASDYESEKYRHTLASLPAAHYQYGLEIGCSIGILTRQLASRCARLLAIDVADEPLSRARGNCETYSNVDFAKIFVPREWPPGVFDLIVISEVVYYLDSEDVVRLASRIDTSLSRGGAIVLVHWTGDTDYPLTGDQAAELLIGSLSGPVELHLSDRRDEYRLDVLVRRNAP